MKRSLLFVSLAAASCGLFAGSARVATSAGQAGALVRLQPAFPGTVQTGHINVSGVIRGDQVNLFGPNVNIVAHSTTGNSIIGKSDSGGAPGIVGVATASTNSGIWGQNDATGAGGLLGAGANGLYAWAGSGGFAGYFNGNTHVGGTLGVNGRIGVNTNSPTHPVSIQDAYYFGLGNGGVTKWVVSSYPDYNSLDIAEEGVAYARMHFSPGGRVGINNEAPQHALDVRGGVVSDSYMRVFGEQYGFIQSANGRDVGTYLDGSGGYVGTTAPNPLHFFTANSWAHATLTTAGNFGIGTETPSSRLEVRASGQNGTESYTNGYDAIRGETTGLDGNGVEGIANNGGSAYGVWGSSTTGYGVVGDGPGEGWGVYAYGRFGASGTKSFRIDHPQDPLNKYLLHYSAEGPEPQNIYNGSVTTNDKGYATVVLPSYYEDINRDARIQVSVVDEADSADFVQAKIVQKVKGGQFVIRTSAPNVEVFWEVKAVRNDLYVQKYGAPVEQEKQGIEKGTYQHPELYDAPPTMGIKYHPVTAPKAVHRTGSKPLPKQR